MKNSALLPPVSNSKRFPLSRRGRERERIKDVPPTNPNAFDGNLRISTEMGSPGDEELTYQNRPIQTSGHKRLTCV
jgi:hypothetical protein